MDSNAEWVREWFRFSDMDFDVARKMTGFHPIPLEIICFHAQQSAEKSLKAYIVYKTGNEPEYTHNLSDLRKVCAEHDERFSEIINACVRLNPYGVAARYPDEIPISEVQMTEALKYTEEIRQLAPLTEVREAIEYAE
jgi:HEPN domain-containing protein